MNDRIEYQRYYYSMIIYYYYVVNWGEGEGTKCGTVSNIIVINNK